MKGLLLKDFYMAKKYCKFYALIALVFCAVSFLSSTSQFFIFYPCILSGLLPVTLLGYDERSKWDLYAGTLPYTKAQLVSCKYLLGLIAQLSIFLLIGIAQAVNLSYRGLFSWQRFSVLLSMLLILSFVSSSITLPPMFRWGVEKGRIAYYVMIGVICGGSIAAANLFRFSLEVEVSWNIPLLVLCAVAIILYALSWYLSIVFYRKREMK